MHEIDDMDSDVDRVLDPNEYHQKRRIKELMDSRKEVRQTKSQIKGIRQTERRISNFKACQLYRTTLTSYLQELQPLMTVGYPEIGKAYWDEIELGVVTVAPPDGEFTIETSGPMDRTVEPVGEHEPKTFELVGLRSIVELPEPLAPTWKIKPKRPREINETIRRTRESEIGWQYLEKAYEQANQFLAQIGLELEADDDDLPSDML